MFPRSTGKLADGSLAIWATAQLFEQQGFLLFPSRSSTLTLKVNCVSLLSAPDAGGLADSAVEQFERTGLVRQVQTCGEVSRAAEETSVFWRSQILRRRLVAE